MSSHVEQIKEKLGIVEVVGSYIELEKAGANFKAKCPFHNEKSPSFFISPVRNSYYCFGCSAKGDIITFVQEFEGLDFIGALRVLAKRAGIELTRENPTLRTEREKMYLAMEHATLFFQRELENNAEALAYLAKRGLTPATIKEWRIGYAAVDWRRLIGYMATRKVSTSDLEKVGLIKKSEKSAGDFYDRFRGRIMFPIFDSSGRVIAFSGRQFVSDGTEAKYLNSPETPLFDKSKVLYGFDRAKLNIRKQDFSLLVEGQMDLLLSHQAGFTNAIASSGTALTTDHLDILRRLSKKLVIAYDGDDAGGAAARRGWQLALGLGMEVSIVSLPQGKDPADVIKEDPKTFTEALKRARHIIDVELDRLVARALGDRERKIAVERELLPYVAGVLSMAERSHFISEIAFKTGMKEDLLWDIVKKIPAVASVGDAPGSPPPERRELAGRMDSLTRMIIGLMYWDEGKQKSDIPSLDIRKKICTIISPEALAEHERSFDKIKDDLVFEAEISFSQSSSIAEQARDLVKNFEEELLREQFAEAMRDLQRAERDKDRVRADELLKRCQEISLKLRSVARKV